MSPVGADNCYNLLIYYPRYRAYNIEVQSIYDCSFLMNCFFFQSTNAFQWIQWKQRGVYEEAAIVSNILISNGINLHAIRGVYPLIVCLRATIKQSPKRGYAAQMLGNQAQKIFAFSSLNASG